MKCSSSNSFESIAIGCNLSGVSHLFDGYKTPWKNVVMHNNPWEQRGISYLDNEVTVSSPSSWVKSLGML